MSQVFPAPYTANYASKMALLLGKRACQSYYSEMLQGVEAASFLLYCGSLTKAVGLRSNIWYSSRLFTLLHCFLVLPPCKL